MRKEYYVSTNASKRLGETKRKKRGFHRSQEIKTGSRFRLTTFTLSLAILTHKRQDLPVSLGRRRVVNCTRNTSVNKVHFF